MENKLQIRTLTVGLYMTNCYIVTCPETREAVIIDPGDDELSILRAIGTDLQVKFIINTHGHIDHIGGNAGIKRTTGAQILIHEADAPMLSSSFLAPGLHSLRPSARSQPDKLLHDGDDIAFGKCTLHVIHTPGHTPGGICLMAEGIVFSGDTLFAGSVGRTDLPGGSFEQLMQSIKNKLLVLDESTRVYPGHGPSTTIGEEKFSNPFLSF